MFSVTLRYLKNVCGLCLLQGFFRRCFKAVAEIREGVANIPQGIKSESTDGYSVTYKDYNADELAEREKRAMYKAIKQELSGTGLLYQGVR